jgi:SAM-dependent methyltransferase
MLKALKDLTRPSRHWLAGALHVPNLDTSYRWMYEPHQSTHRGLILEMADIRNAERLSRDVLEVACGTGWNIANFVDAGFNYYGLDISETAIAKCIKKAPSAKFLNVSVDDLTRLKDGAFDLIYCASMLEHLEDYERTLAELIRIACGHLFVTFYDGLNDGDDDKIEFHEDLSPALLKYGVKWNQYQKSNGGYFMNRYSRRTVSEISSRSGAKRIEFLDASNRAYIQGVETVLHVRR